MTQLERLEVKASLVADEAGSVTGIAWPFGAPDSVGDLIEPTGVRFADRVPMLLEHNQKSVVGLWESLAVTADGVEVKGSLFVDGVAPARDARQTMQRGLMTGLSIGYQLHEAKARPEGGRVLQSLTITEISLCRKPVHPAARVTEVKSEGNDMTTPAVETKSVDEFATELKAANDNIASLTKRLDDAETKLARPEIKGTQNAEVSEERRSFATYLRYGNQTPVEEIKALTVAEDTQAGYLAPVEMSTEFIRNLVEFSPIRQYASVRATSAPAVRYPKRTSITNAQWEGELEESDESDVTFGQLEVGIHRITTFVDISNELLGDSAGAAETEVRLALAEDFGSKEAVAFVKGSGVKQPEGLMNHADILHTVNGSATALSPDKLIDLLYALPAAYRNAPGAAWAMNGSTLAAVRKLKDGQQNFLWQPSYQAGQPETILGKPVVEMVDLDDIGDGKFPIIFGDFSAYRIVDRLAMSILSDPYTQARRGVTRIHATRRTGGRVLQAARFRKLKTSTS